MIPFVVAFVLSMCLSPRRAALAWLAAIAVQADAGPVHIAVADVCLLLLAASFCVSRITLAVPRVAITYLVGAFAVLFLVVGTGTTLLRYGTVPTWTWLNKDLGLLLLLASFFLVMAALRHEKPGSIVRWFIGSTGLVNGAVLVVWFLHLGAAFSPESMSQGVRLMGFMKDPNAYCGFMAVAALMTFPLIIGKRGQSLRINTILLATFVTFLISAVLTLSRGGILALLVGLFATALTLRHRLSVLRVLWLVALVSLLVGVVAQLSALDQLIARVQDSVTVDSRVELNRAAFRLYTENPITVLTGTGVGSFLMTMGNQFGEQIHNTFLWLLVEGGPILFFAFVSLLCVALHRAYRLAKLDWSESQAAAGCFGSLVALSIWCTTVEGMYQREFWMVLAVLAVIEAHKKHSLLPTAHPLCRKKPLSVRPAYLHTEASA